MRPTLVSLLTFATAGRQPSSRAGTWPLDPTDVKARVLNIDGVRYELLLPPHAKMLAVSVTASSFVIKRPCEAE